MFRFISNLRLSSHKDRFGYVFRNYSTSVEQPQSHLTIKDMPRPKTIPIFTKLQLMTTGGANKLHEFIDIRHKELGTIFCDKLTGDSDLVFISDPVLTRTLFINLDGKYPVHILPEPWILYEKLYGSKRGLFFMNGEEWLNNRRIMNRHLLREDSDKWLEAPVRTTIEKFIENWKTKSDNKAFSPDLESEFYKLSTDVIIAVLLGVNSTINPSRHYEQLLCLFSDSVKKIFETTTKLCNLPLHWCYHLNLNVWKNFKECVDTSLSLAHKIVTEMLNQKQTNNGLIKKLCEENINDETIVRIVADFVIAAGDTTTYTSLWTLFLLSQNDDIIKELRMKNDSYVKYILKESMRLYPVAPFLTRILPKESILGSYKIDKGTPVIASIYTSGRDEQNFSCADKFLPYRWDRNDIRKKDLVNHEPSASLPFALGARSCIGRKIALLQLTELINQVVNNFDLRCTNAEEIQAKTSQVLVPNKQIKMSISPRT